MTRLLNVDDIAKYCDSSPEERERWFWEIDWQDAGPAYYLSIFEVCRSIACRERPLSVQHFTACWQELVARHNNLTGDMPLLWVESFNQPANLYPELQQIPAPPPGERGTGSNDDDHLPMVSRFAALSTGLLCQQAKLGSGHRAISGPANWPDIRLERRATDSIVLDTNSLLPLLNQLNRDGSWPVPIQTREGLHANARRRCHKLLEDPFKTHKIIIPFSVLEEADRVSSRKTEYENARYVLEALTGSDAPLWATFEIQSISIEILACFLEVRSVCKLYLADALVVAHAIYNGCALASAELEGEDQQWQAVLAAFPFISMAM